MGRESRAARRRAAAGGPHLLLPLLAAPAQPQHQVERRLLLDVVVRQRAAVLQLLARENEALLVRRDPLLVLDLRLHILDRVAALHLEGDRLPRERLRARVAVSGMPRGQKKAANPLNQERTRAGAVARGGQKRPRQRPGGTGARSKGAAERQASRGASEHPGQSSLARRSRRSQTTMCGRRVAAGGAASGRRRTFTKICITGRLCRLALSGTCCHAETPTKHQLRCASGGAAFSAASTERRTSRRAESTHAPQCPARAHKPP